MKFAFEKDTKYVSMCEFATKLANYCDGWLNASHAEKALCRVGKLYENKAIVSLVGKYTYWDGEAATAEFEGNAYRCEMCSEYRDHLGWILGEMLS